MSKKLLEIWVEDECQYCGQNFLLVAKGEDEYGNEKGHVKCRYCGSSFFDKIGANEFTHLEGWILERVLEYLQQVNPLVYSKKGQSK